MKKIRKTALLAGSMGLLLISGVVTFAVIRRKVKA